MGLLLPLKLLFLPLRLLGVKPLSFLLKPIKTVYWLAGAVAVTGFFAGVWLGNLDLLGTMGLLLVAWSVSYSFLYGG